MLVIVIDVHYLLKLLTINLNMETIIGAVILFVISFIAIFTNIFKGRALTEAFTYRLVKWVGGNNALSHDDLKNHYIFIKFETINLDKISNLYSIFNNAKKFILFKDYVNIIINVNKESVLSIVDIDLVNMTETKMQHILLSQAAWREAEYNNRFRTYLQGKIEKNSDIDMIIAKVEIWRRKELAVTTDCSIEVLNYQKAGSLYNKLYTIFHQYSICLEIMVHSGAESFSLMNGELDVLLTNNSKEN